jgi:hypothetical protein
MAGDWIKMECCTPEKAEVLAITAKMGWDDVDLTVGKLFRMWRWFDQHTENGNARGVTSALLDRIIGTSGFCEAVQSVGWIEIREDGINLPNFERHNGNTAKNRALTAKRVAKNKAKGNATGNAAGVTSALPKEEKNRDSVTTVTGGEPPVQDPPAVDQELTDKDKIFAYGVPILVNAGNTDKAARSFLAGKCKDHGDSVVVQAIRDCYREQPVDPLAWLGKRLPMKKSSHSGFQKVNYREGINDDGSFS